MSKLRVEVDPPYDPRGAHINAVALIVNGIFSKRYVSDEDLEYGWALLEHLYEELGITFVRPTKRLVSSDLIDYNC